MLGAQQAFAGAKIASPAKKNRFEEVILEVSVNQQATTKNMILLLSENDVLWMSAEDLSFWRVIPPKNADYHHQEGVKFYKLTKFSGVKTTLDAEKGSLAIDFPVSYFQQVSLMAEPKSVLPNPAPNGGFINYEFFATDGNNTQTNVDTTLDLGVFNKYGTGNLSVLGRNINENGKYVRLETTWTVDKPFNMASLRIGDGISRGGMWGRPIRFGGIQWSTNFATQPEYITTPLLNISANAALPSTLDLFINNVQTYQQQLAPGAFSINNLPLVSGAGDARLIVRDILGREQVIVQPYYVSRTLLREGLSDYSYEIGAERINYTLRSNDYDRLSASATHRYGFSNRFTGEVHADAQEGRASAGVTGVYRIGYFGVLDASVATSNSERGNGSLGVLGFERQANQLSFGARTQIASRDFSYQGMQAQDQVPVSLTNAFVGFNLQNLGSLSVNYLNQNYRDQTDAEIVSVNYNKNISRDWFFNANAFTSLKDNNYNLGFNLVYVLGNRTSASFTANKTQGQDQALLQVQKSLPIGTGFGFRTLAEVQGNNRFEAGLSYQNDYGTYTVEASKIDNARQYRGSIAGSIARVEGENYFARRLGESFAIVEVPGYKNINVYSQNQLVGTTNQTGKVLVPSLRAYQRNQISIDPKDLPIEAEVEEYRLEAVPYFRSADYVKFAINSDRSATLTITLADGTAVPAGAEVRFADSSNQTASFPVGAAGLTYLRGFKVHSHLIAKWQGGKCEFDVDYMDTNEITPDLGSFVCR